MAYQAYPYRGEQPPGLLDNLLEWLGSVTSSDPYPPGHLASSDMSTRTDMRPEEQLTAMPPGLISDPPDPNLSLSPAQKKALAIAAPKPVLISYQGPGSIYQDSMHKRKHKEQQKHSVEETYLKGQHMLLPSHLRSQVQSQQQVW